MLFVAWDPWFASMDSGPTQKSAGAGGKSAESGPKVLVEEKPRPSYAAKHPRPHGDKGTATAAVLEALVACCEALLGTENLGLALLGRCSPNLR